MNISNLYIFFSYGLSLQFLLLSILSKFRLADLGEGSLGLSFIVFVLGMVAIVERIRSGKDKFDIFAVHFHLISIFGFVGCIIQLKHLISFTLAICIFLIITWLIRIFYILDKNNVSDEIRKVFVTKLVYFPAPVATFLVLVNKIFNNSPQLDIIKIVFYTVATVVFFIFSFISLKKALV